MQEKRHDRVVEMRLCFFLGKVGDYNVSFVETRMCRSTFDEKAKKKNITLHYTMNVEHEHVLTDVTKIKEIFVNILSNAIKYTPSGGAVMVDVAELPCEEPGNMIEKVRVNDTGIGM